MTMHFPNASRSFDARREGVRFWGYDSALEIPFFVSADALRKLDPGMAPGGNGCLASFDLRRDHIEQVARKMYHRGMQDAYELGAEDV